MKDELRRGSLDAEFSISDERARELLAQIAAGDAERPFTELAAAYGRQIRRILGARVRDKTELEDVEQDFWVAVVQNAGKYAGKAPVVRWLSVIASRLGIDSYSRLRRRQDRVEFRAEMAAKMLDDGEQDDLDLERLADKMLDDGEQDDLDLERLADKDAVAEKRELTPDEVLEQEELAEAMIRLVRFLERSEDRAARLIFRRYIEGASCKQMAAEEHITDSCMRQQVCRAMASMRQTLIHVYHGGGGAIWNMRGSNPRRRRRIYGFAAVG